MRRPVLPLLVVAVLAAAPQREDPVPIVRRWIEAVKAHHPGEVDQPLIDMATEPPEHFRVVGSNLQHTLDRDATAPALQNDLRRRGALLHTDIALLLPRQAAALESAVVLPPVPSRERPIRMSGKLVLLTDGKYVETDIENGHWPFAHWLLGGVTPHPSRDEFVRLWYRAVAATFQSEYLLGSSALHLDRARRALPRDPILLFYTGAMYEALAAPAFQNVPATAPGAFHRVNLPSEDDQLREAQRFLNEAVKTGAPLEAQLRLGRVLGRLGKHADAVRLLSQTVPPADDKQLAYFRELLLGTEQGALGQVEAARTSFDRAATLFPTAQAPLVAMSHVFRQSGDRTAALDAFRRLQALPADASERIDPWWDYYRSYAADAEGQLAAVRAWVGLKEAR